MKSRSMPLAASTHFFWVFFGATFFPAYTANTERAGGSPFHASTHFFWFFFGAIFFPPYTANTERARGSPFHASRELYTHFLLERDLFSPHTQRPQNAPGDRRSMPLATSTHGSTHGYLQPQHSSQPAPLQHSSPHAAGAVFALVFFWFFFLVRFRCSFPLSFFFSTVVSFFAAVVFFSTVAFFSTVLFFSTVVFFFAAVVFFFTVAPSPILLLGNVLLFFVYPPHSSAWHTLWRTVGAAMKVVLSVFVHVHVRIHIRICMHIHIHIHMYTHTCSLVQSWCCNHACILLLQYIHISFFSLSCTQFVQQSRRHPPLPSPGGPCGTLRLTPHKVCNWNLYTHTHTHTHTHVNIYIYICIYIRIFT